MSGAQPGFGAGAARLAGMAAVLLGWRTDDFWAATPAELAAALAALAPAGGAGAAVTADELRALAARFPD